MGQFDNKFDTNGNYGMLGKIRPLERDHYKPLYMQLDDILRAYIQDNGLKPGDVMPSEHELIAHFGVSQMTVRQALQRLATSGTIVRHQGKGTFVAEPKISERIEGIQSLEQRFAKQGLKVTTHLVEALLTNSGVQQTNALGLPPGSQTFKVKRLKKVDGKVLAIEARHFPVSMKDYFSQEELHDKPFIEILGLDPERAIHCIEYHTKSEILMELDAGMMGVQPGLPILTQYGIFHNRNDEPMMAGRMSYLGEKIEIIYEVKSSGGYDISLVK